MLKSEDTLSSEKIELIRKAFYSVLLELFAYYKEFVGKDNSIFGGDTYETTFDVKRFCQISNKQYRDFYQQFFFGASESKPERLSNQLFMNFISQQTVNNYNNIQCAVIHFNESVQKLQDGEAIAPHKRPHPFLQDESQGFKEDVEAPPVQYSQVGEQELKDSYFKMGCKLYPVEKSGEYG